MLPRNLIFLYKPAFASFSSPRCLSTHLILGHQLQPGKTKLLEENFETLWIMSLWKPAGLEWNTLPPLCTQIDSFLLKHKLE